MILALKGENYTGKTAFASSFPKNLLHLETDVGGFARVAPQFKKELEAGEIITIAYPSPKEVLRDNLGVAISEKVSGMRELWVDICTSMCNALDDPKIKTVVIDTFSQMYAIGMDMQLQLIQERQERRGEIKAGKPYRERIQREEYRDVNTRMHSIIDEAVRCNTNLVLIHHMEDQYGQVQKGDRVEDSIIGRDAKGWRKCGMAASDLMDYVILMERGDTHKKFGNGRQDPNRFYGTVQKAGQVRSLQGVVFEDPTYDDLVTRINFELMKQG